MKNDKRENDLADFNNKVSNKEDLHKQLIEMDKKVKHKQSLKQQ